MTASPYGTNYQYDNLWHVNLVSATLNPCSGCPTKETITYDARDHAISIDDGISTTNNTVTPSGRVLTHNVRRDSDGTSTERTQYGYAGTGDSPAYAWTSGSNTITTYFTGPGGLLIIDTGGTPTYPVEDGHGDVVGNTDASGTFSVKPDTDEFGVGPTVSGHLAWLGGKERFQTAYELGLIQMGVRLYQPSLGRFLEVDPIRGGSANDYVYANQDPVNASDPKGAFYTICDGSVDCAVQEGGCYVCHSYPTNGSDFNLPTAPKPGSITGSPGRGPMPSGSASPSPTPVGICEVPTPQGCVNPDPMPPPATVYPGTQSGTGPWCQMALGLGGSFLFVLGFDIYAPSKELAGKSFYGAPGVVVGGR